MRSRALARVPLDLRGCERLQPPQHRGNNRHESTLFIGNPPARHIGHHSTLVFPQLPKDLGLHGATYAIPILYVPMLMITHVLALYWLVRPQPAEARALAGDVAAS